MGARRPEPGAVPTDPGVYRFRDHAGRVIYVGKAKSLRARLSSYFQDPAGLAPRTAAMVEAAATVDWVVVGTEVEALQLEYTWIKEHDPRFNIRYRDDKSYPFLAVSVAEEYPRAFVVRGDKRPGIRYFGPYAHAWAIRETLDILLRVFPIRTCSAGVFRRAQSSQRPCLLGYIDRCAAPCVARVTPDEHRAIVESFCAFMAGQTRDIERTLQRQMAEAAESLDFERAARYRDDLQAIERAMEKSAVVLADGTDADVIALSGDQLQAAVQVFHVRDGRIRGQRGFVVDRVDEGDDSDLMEDLLQQIYSEGALTVPAEVLVSVLPVNASVLREWLSAKRSARVDLRVPSRGDKRALMETVLRNSVNALHLHTSRRTSDLTTRSRALREIQEALFLGDAPLRIECIDISHLQGENAVGSLIVFEDGLPKPSDYRTFAIRGDGNDDLKSIAEVVTRRFQRAMTETQDSAGLGGPTSRRAFAYPPQLLLIDGGEPQAAAAQQALAELGVVDVPVAGIAKRLEELWVPGESMPTILSRSSEGLFLLQRIRDEAHRFALSRHRRRRTASVLVSELDAIPGLGPERRKALLREFGSVAALRQADPVELQAVPGIGPAMASAIIHALHPTEPAEE